MIAPSSLNESRVHGSTVATATPSKRLSVKPWGHDCREHRSWRCVWCESSYCFECDTGTTAFMDRFPYHRLCSKHVAELPGGTIPTHKPSSELSTPSTINPTYSPMNRLSMSTLGGDTEYSHKESCHCLIPKTMLCTDCVQNAKLWQAEQSNIFERSGIIECALGRFPGGCKADINAKCGCGGRGIGCNFISEKDWQKFEASDFKWLGSTGLEEDQFQKKEKKDLRNIFGDNFPVRAVDSFDAKKSEKEKKQERPVHSVPLTTTPLTSPKKQSWSFNFGLRRTRSISILGSPKRTISLCDPPCPGSSSSSDKHPNVVSNNVPTTKTFLTNPQMRKPYSNFRVSPNDLKPPAPMRRTLESYLDTDSEDDDDDNEVVERESSNDDGKSDYASIADSISTLGSEYDYEDTFELKSEAEQKSLDSTPTSMRLNTAMFAAHQITPRLVQMRSSPNLKPEIIDITISKKMKEKKKWGCRNEVDTSQIDLRTIQAHGFWRCSFCNGRIRGV